MTSKSLEFFFIAAQLLLGFDTGFLSHSNKRKSLVNWVTSLSTGFILCSSIFAVVMRKNDISFYIFLVCYFLSIVLFKFGYSYTIKNLCDDMVRIDNKWNTGVSDYKFGIFIGLHVLIMTLFKWAVSVAYAVVFGLNEVFIMLDILMIIVPMTPLGFLPVINLVVFRVVNKRFKALKTGLKNYTYDLAAGRDMFNDIADCLENIRAAHDNMVSYRRIVHVKNRTLEQDHNI